MKNYIFEKNNTMAILNDIVYNYHTKKYIVWELDRILCGRDIFENNTDWIYEKIEILWEVSKYVRKNYLIYRIKNLITRNVSEV